MSDDDAPDWNLLHGDLEAFFGLLPGYGRRELKLAYAALIKIYKPEQRPEEFQLIRAAYDTLDARLRGAPTLHGASWPSFPRTVREARRDAEATEYDEDEDDHEDHHEDDHEDDHEEASSDFTWEQSREELLALLDASGPEIVYERLRDVQRRAPVAYEWLAFLSDVVPGDSAAGALDPFSRWLTLGLNEYPGHRGLLALLGHRCRQPHPFDVIPHILTSLADMLTADDFARVSEPLFRQYLEQAPFETFAALHLRLVRGVGFRISPAIVALRISLLRAALWRAPPEWVADEWIWVQEHQQLTSDLELDALEALHDYREARHAGLARGELHDAIEQVARAACDQDEVRAENLFLELQARIVDQPDLLIATFPRGDATASQVLSLLDTIALQLAIPGRPTVGIEDHEPMRVRAFALLRLLHRRSWRSPLGLLWQLCSGSVAVMGLLFMVAVACILIVSVITLLPEKTRRPMMVFLITGVLLLARRTKRLIIDRLWQWIRQSLAERLYHRLGRRDVLVLMRDQDALVGVLERVVNSIATPTLTSLPWLQIGIAGDPLLPLLSFALRFA